MEKTKARIFYTSLRDEDTAHEKRDWFGTTKFEDIEFENIRPDKNHNWVNLAEDSDWEELLPIASKGPGLSIFQFSTLGISTNRDEWVYDLVKNPLGKKIAYLIEKVNFGSFVVDSEEIKLSRDLKAKVRRGSKSKFDPSIISSIPYRPFTKLEFYPDQILVDGLRQQHFQISGKDLNQENFVINYTDVNSGKPFMAMVTEKVSDLHFVGAGSGTMNLPLNCYDNSGNHIDNITDWGLAQFQNHFQDEGIVKESIFHYVYAVLHNPAYRKKYELNLKREFPRIPFYDDFAQWTAWGKELMDLHIGYETVEPWPLELVTAETRPEMKKQKELFAKAEEPEVLYGYHAKPKVKLKADKTSGIIELDELSLLKGIPKEAWEYKLGNRSALEWILDQYKEKKPSDPTIAEKFNTYRFADYKEKVIDLLKRVCRVSVETVRIVEKMGTL